MEKRIKGITGEKTYECSVCGFDYRESQLTEQPMYHSGKICFSCVDDIGHEEEKQKTNG